MQVLCGIFLAQTFKMNRAVPLWQRDSFVLSNSLCQSLEFSFAEFQDRKPFFPKALFRFGTGTALSCPLPYAKAWNSALPNSRIESRFSPKLCVALAPGQPCFIHCLMPKPVKAGFYKPLFRFGTGTALFYSLPYAKAWNSALLNSEYKDRFYKALCRFGNGTALSYPLPYAKAWNSALPNSRIESRFSPKLCVALATVQLCLIHCLMPKPGKAGFYKPLFRFGNGTALSYPIPCAKAWNSALPNSRIESRFSQKLCVALVT